MLSVVLTATIATSSLAYANESSNLPSVEEDYPQYEERASIPKKLKEKILVLLGIGLGADSMDTEIERQLLTFA